MKTEKRHQELLEASQNALAEAGRDAIARGKQTETPVWVWKDGQWVDALSNTLYTGDTAKPPPLARVREKPKDQ